MDINKYTQKGLLTVKVIPHAQQSKVVEDAGILKIYLTSIPDKNKANLELIQFFKREFNLRVRIKSGMKSRNKILEVVE